MGDKPMRFSLPDETSDLSWHLYACSTGRPLSLSNWRRFKQSHLVPGERCCE